MLSVNSIQACGYLLYTCLKAVCKYACMCDSVFLCVCVGACVCVCVCVLGGGGMCVCVCLRRHMCVYFHVLLFVHLHSACP